MNILIRLVFFMTILSPIGCAKDGAQGPQGEPGVQGEAGEAGATTEPCTVEQLEEGGALVTCPDGTEAIIIDKHDQVHPVKGKKKKCEE